MSSWRSSIDDNDDEDENESRSHRFVWIAVLVVDFVNSRRLGFAFVVVAAVVGENSKSSRRRLDDENVRDEFKEEFESESESSFVVSNEPNIPLSVEFSSSSNTLLYLELFIS
jgi:hypothetical protein